MNAKNKRGVGRWAVGAGLLLIGLMVLCGCGKQPQPQSLPVVAQETDEQLAQDELTNDVVGYSRTVQILIAKNPDGSSEGYATVEFVNHWGGIDRTNLIYDFTNAYPGFSTTRYAELDFEKMAAAQSPK